MRSVLAIGSGGAGKSTLARRLSARAGLPLLHRDRFYWKPGRLATPDLEFEAILRDLIARERRVSLPVEGLRLATSRQKSK